MVVKCKVDGVSGILTLHQTRRSVLGARLRHHSRTQGALLQTWRRHEQMLHFFKKSCLCVVVDHLCDLRARFLRGAPVDPSEPFRLLIIECKAGYVYFKIAACVIIPMFLVCC